ncbi:Glycine cleavage system transcriptional activator [Vibrio aerogenes CECT 7868]|uniref:Glycine cleavage system transcriptional activator n=1 Tax=Vibrio aerogenes CECT 7868 TaxID=1216006 RepID=A0A1M5Z4W0_9VIBR|nr:LysR substrate-binding domain-containing protein [Vibrio aerogenes]SHI19292.1 Glycine cleavage system transcriptional activator [Vibrio aerogenes CECT 7868]
MDKRLRWLSGLRYFEVSARLGSYTKAARELCVSQAAVSQKIRQLEEALDCKLFVRHKRDMRLTRKGEILFERVNDGFGQIISGLNTIQSEPVEGPLEVYTTPSFASRWLMPKLWKFTMRYPKIQVRVYSCCEIPDQDYTRVDVAIWQNLITELDNRRFHKELLFEEALIPFCSPELAESIKFTTPEQLLKCWLIEGIDAQHTSWQHWFQVAGVAMSGEDVMWMEVTTFDMALNAVAAGHGACLAPLSFADDFIERGLLVKPFDIALTPGLRFDIWHDPESSRLARIEVFKNWLREETDT